MRHNRHYDQQFSLALDAAKLLNPTQRHDFLLRLEGKLKMTRQFAPSDVMLVRCIQLAFGEVVAA